MPETRKHRVEPRDELDRAILAAMGEPVRPTTPGEDRLPPSAESYVTDEPDAEAPAKPASAKPATPTFTTPGTTLGAFTFPTTKG